MQLSRVHFPIPSVMLYTAYRISHLHTFPLKLQVCKTLIIIITLFWIPRLTAVKEKLFHVMKDVGFQESTIAR
jgi:hypothetical protein